MTSNFAWQMKPGTLSIDRLSLVLCLHELSIGKCSQLPVSLYVFLFGSENCSLSKNIYR